jgi:hypothetical protein
VLLPKKKKKNVTKQGEEAKRREENERTDITGEICNYVRWNHRHCCCWLLTIAHTITVAGGIEKRRKEKCMLH